MFSGLLYCADCGEKLYYSVTNNYKREQAYFFCSAYRKNSDVCSAHYIREKVVEQLVLESMQRVLWYVQSYEKLFAQRQLAEFGEKQKKEFAEKRRELDKSKLRGWEIAIHYNGIGIIREPTPEEMEEYFQEHSSKKSFVKAKTA